MSTEDTGPIEPTTITISDNAAGSAADTPVWLETIVPLKFPIQSGGQRIAAITLREPDAEQLEEIEKRARGKLNYAAVREAVSVLSNIPVDDLKRLNGRDLRALVVAVNPLVGLSEEDETAA